MSVLIGATQSVQAAAGGFEPAMLAALLVIVGGVAVMLGVLFFYGWNNSHDATDVVEHDRHRRLLPLSKAA